MPWNHVRESAFAGQVGLVVPRPGAPLRDRLSALLGTSLRGLEQAASEHREAGAAGNTTARTHRGSGRASRGPVAATHLAAAGAPPPPAPPHRALRRRPPARLLPPPPPRRSGLKP